MRVRNSRRCRDVTVGLAVATLAAGTVMAGTAQAAEGTAGYYRWQIHAYSGGGSYTLKYDNP